MKHQPHAFFTRSRYGKAITIEVNSHVHLGNSSSGPMFEYLAIRQGMNPFWSYESGFESSPIWVDGFGRYFGARQQETPSYIRILRMAVCLLTGGTTGDVTKSKIRLGFHSSYRTRKRNSQRAA